METNFTAELWLPLLILGALLGAAGQVVRAIAGMKKLSEEAAAAQMAVSDMFSGSRLLISIIIGAVAGVLGTFALGIKPGTALEPDKMIALIGIGYSGADFIEAFMRRAAPATETQGAPKKDASAAATAPTPEARPSPETAFHDARAVG